MPDVGWHYAEPGVQWADRRVAPDPGAATCSMREPCCKHGEVISFGYLGDAE